MTSVDSDGDQGDVLGRCPNCENVIVGRDASLAYEGEPWPAVLAECEDCLEVVHPTSFF